jgi:hypothetical protein
MHQLKILYQKTRNLHSYRALLHLVFLKSAIV